MITRSGTVLSLPQLRTEARDARALYEALLTGEASWRDIRPEYTAGDRQSLAIDEAYQQMREAEQALARATGGRS